MTIYIKVLAISILAAFATGCPTVDLGDNPPEPGICRPDPLYFETQIWISYVTAPAISCINDAGCHRQNDGRSSLRIDFDPGNPGQVDLGAAYNIVTRFPQLRVPGLEHISDQAPIGHRYPRRRRSLRRG